MKKTLIVSCFCCTLLATFASAEPLVFSMLPRYFPEKLTAITSPLVNYLSQELQQPVKLLLTDSFSSYENQIFKGTIDIGYENPLVYVNISEKHEVLATAIQGQGGDRFRGLVIARADSNITNLADLRGKTVMIVGKTSAGGYLSQKLSLQELGMDVKNDLSLVEAADNRQENVIISVSVGDVDAGFIQEGAYHVADDFIRPNSLKKVVETAWIPNWAISVNKTMPLQLKNNIRQALQKLKKDDEVLKALELTGFKPVVDSDYNILRKVIE
ncbi:MAG: phosphate/phosphite/phosphonate ABC transporter substrate-binding protein [Desulforhopalus sp.]|nr:phosphate/phosphite/phosphonate ABC transporter substrate-binding protein [Desulforhopalus sp.]